MENKQITTINNNLPNKSVLKKQDKNSINNNFKKSNTQCMNDKYHSSKNVDLCEDHYVKDPLSLFKKMKTFQNVKLSESAALLLMSENIYSMPSYKNNDQDLSSEISDDENSYNEAEINLKHRRIKVKSKTLKKISIVAKRASNTEYNSNNTMNIINYNNYSTGRYTYNIKKSSESDLDNNSIYKTNKLNSNSNIKESCFKNQNNSHKLNFNSEKELIIHTENEEIPSDNNNNLDVSCKFIDELNICKDNNYNSNTISLKGDEDTNSNKYSNDVILNNLIDQYYLDIIDNFLGNFEDYVVNNLTIISYLNKLLLNNRLNNNKLCERNVIPYNKLSEENLNIVKKCFNKNKKILFLDLDETLIHSDLHNKFNNLENQVSIPVDDDSYAKINILIRPHLKEFLEFVSKNFNVVLFTAGIESYANSILGHIDPLEEYFHLRLYRDSCYQYNNFFIKDLKIIEDFNEKDMIIIDNCVYSFALNLNNGILIPSYYNDSEDTELLSAIDYLKEKLMNVDDIRKVNEEYYGLETITNFLYDKLVSEGVITN